MVLGGSRIAGEREEQGRSPPSEVPKRVSNVSVPGSRDLQEFREYGQEHHAAERQEVVVESASIRQANGDRRDPKQD
jgi:hypothetical protein